MSEKLKESLSAAMDDEADEFELRRVLDEVHKDPELRELWERYHMVGRALRGDAPELGGTLRERVWAALDAPQDVDDLEITAPERQAAAAGSTAWLGRITGIAVAAGVAFAVIFGVGELGQGEPQIAESQVMLDGPARTAPQFNAEVSASDLRRANAYMMHHVQQQALNQPGVTSFVKLVTFEEQ